MCWRNQHGHTVVARGVVRGKHTGRVVQRGAAAGPVDLLCLGPNYVFGGSVVVQNDLVNTAEDNKISQGFGGILKLVSNIK